MPEPQQTEKEKQTTSQPASTTTTTIEPVSTAKTYSEQEFSQLQTELTEYKRQLANASQFIETDPEVKQRLNLYAESFKNNKPYQDMIKEWEAKRATTSAPEKPKPESGMTPEQIREMVRRESETMLKPFTENQANQSLRESMDSILKSNTWATEKDWDTFSQRFNDLVQNKATKMFNDQYPRLNQRQAFDAAVASFVDVDDNILFDALMKPEREEAILGKRRMAPKLPEGMLENITTGKDADILDKARKAYASIEGDGEKVAALIKEYAPQFGVSADDRAGIQKIYSLITK